MPQRPTPLALAGIVLIVGVAAACGDEHIAQAREVTAPAIAASIAAGGTGRATAADANADSEGPSAAAITLPVNDSITS